MVKGKTKTARAFAPAAISSFFEIHDTEAGKPIADLERVGARGGGFGIEKGVSTEVTVRESNKSSVNVFINSDCAEEARTTKKVIDQLLIGVTEKYEITVEPQD